MNNNSSKDSLTGIRVIRTSSTSILSNPTGPSDDLTMLAIAVAAVTFWVRTSCQESPSSYRSTIGVYHPRITIGTHTVVCGIPGTRRGARSILLPQNAD